MKWNIAIVKDGMSIQKSTHTVTGGSVQSKGHIVYLKVDQYLDIVLVREN